MSGEGGPTPLSGPARPSAGTRGAQGRPRTSTRLPVTLPCPAYLGDHRADGRPVLPAVEALQLLAAAVHGQDPQLDVRRSRDAVFLRFLAIAPSVARDEVWIELAPAEDGSAGVQAALCSKARMGRAGLVRSLEHVRAVFGSPSLAPPQHAPTPGPGDLPAGRAFSFPAERLYAELVTFGPAFHNACGPVLLGTDGARCLVAAPAEGEGQDLTAPAAFPRLLGSPFPLDAAFHLACAWGQRHLGRVLFPTGYGERIVHRPIPARRRLLCQVRLCEQAADRATFDLWLYEEDGRLAEAARAVLLQDVFAGRISVPAWVQAGCARSERSA
ncbi:MAG: hypothetical protein FJ125_06735 [Deltaproteobacteria bacterium]|nr:hypothetical protein [Deltaproteobacteria bacterium]